MSRYASYTAAAWPTPAQQHVEDTSKSQRFGGAITCAALQVGQVPRPTLLVASPVDPKLNCSTYGVNGLLHGFAVGTLFGPLTVLTVTRKVPKGLASRLGLALMVRESLKAAGCCSLGLGSYQTVKCASYRLREEKDDVWNYIYAGGLSGAAVGGVRPRNTLL